MHSTTTLLLIAAFLAIIALSVWTWRRFGFKYWAVGIAVVALVAVSVATINSNKPLEAWADHNDRSKGIATFTVSKAHGNYQGHSFAFDSKLDKDQVFSEFKSQYTDAIISNNHVSVQVSGEELRVVYVPDTGAPDYTLEFVDP